MIRIIKGTYGHIDGGRIVPKTSKDPPFALSPEKEAKLVGKGVAQYVESINEEPAATPKKKAKRGG